MYIQPTNIPNLLIITSEPRRDERGYFMETYRKDKLAEAGITDDFVQHNETLSLKKGIVRGFHFQVPGYNRIARVSQGSIFFAAVDLRVNSPTLRHTFSRALLEFEQMYVPAGVAWAFMALEDGTQMQYISSKTYDGAADRTIRFTIPGVEWPDLAPMLSKRDDAGMTIEEWLVTEESKNLII